VTNEIEIVVPPRPAGSAPAAPLFATLLAVGHRAQALLAGAVLQTASEAND